MKIKKLLYASLLLVVFNSCKTNREVQKNSSRVDSTATSSKEVAKGSTLVQQNKNNRLDSSHTSGKNRYQRQTVSYQFTPDSSNKNKGNGTGLFPLALENRLTGITVTTEQGTQATQTGSLTRQNSDLLNVAKDSSKSEEKKSTAVNKKEDAKHIVATHRVGSSLWLIILLLILVIVLVIWIWKGKLIAAFINRIRTAIKGGTPNTPA